MAQDTERLVDFSRIFHRMWTAPFIIIAGVSYMYPAWNGRVQLGAKRLYTLVHSTGLRS